MWLSDMLREQLARRVCAVMWNTSRYTMPEWVANGVVLAVTEYLDAQGFTRAVDISGAAAES
jgi:hypothetical protein